MKIVVALLSFAVLVYSIPIDESEHIEIEPNFDTYRDVRLLLSTRRNRGNPIRIAFRNAESIRSSPFDPAKPTRILVHGWWEDETSAISVNTSEELLNYYDFNVIFVDWSVGSQTINYIGAANRVETIGFFIASQVLFMRDYNFLDFDRLHVIGFSLGAHIAGFIGKYTDGEINTIIGLDPAGPLFSERRPDGRIDANDAKYVECLHTNGAGLIGAGIGAPICQADFYPNGGSGQPGCWTNTCSHNRAVELYVESIIDNGFHAEKCETERDATRENCNAGSGFWFGGEPSNARLNLTGIFHFKTNRSYPYALGPIRP